MKPVDIQAVGRELAVKWDDGSEQFIPLETLRRACPCASCAGETDVLGNTHKGPEQTLSDASFQLRQLLPVGGYAVQLLWADGHGSGLYSHESLRNLG